MMATAMNAVVNLSGVRLMRLIDADALISFIDPEHLRHSGELTFSEVDVINMLNHAPTAFDVEELRSNSETTSKWVPCSERLPENAMNVIAQFSSGTVTELRYAGNGIFEGIYEYEYSTKVIIAWMPLPKPYREVDDEKNQ